MTELHEMFVTKFIQSRNYTEWASPFWARWDMERSYGTDIGPHGRRKNTETIGHRQSYGKFHAAELMTHWVR